MSKYSLEACGLLLSKPRELSTGAVSFNHETAAKVFLIGKSGPKGQVEFWQNTSWEFIVLTLWVQEPTQVFIFPLLWTCTFTCSRIRTAINRVRGVLEWRVGKQPQLATSCSIWPHEILAFTGHKHISLFLFLVHPCPFSLSPFTLYRYGR